MLKIPSAISSGTLRKRKQQMQLFTGQFGAYQFQSVSWQNYIITVFD
jgi:hypothetical protein